MTYVETWYSRRLGAASARLALDGAFDAEACVVGGGLAGLSTALELARTGRRVCVLEARRIAWGASGRNGGFVSPGYSAGWRTLSQRVGAARAETLHRLSIEGVRAVADNIETLGITAAAPVKGYLSASRHEATDDLLAYRDWAERTFDYPVAFWERDRVREALRSDRYHQGLHQPEAFHIDPLAYSLGLAAEIERLGGRVFEDSPAVSLSAGPGERRVATARGRVRADEVVIATGGYTGRWQSRLHASYLPVATYVMLTRPDGALIAEAIRTTAAIGDRRRAGDYYRLVQGGERILWGGKITTRTREPRDLARVLRASMVATYPQLRGLEVDIAWSGLMAYARHLMPQVVRLVPGLWGCTAFGGHGVNTTAIAGRALAEAITGQSDRIAAFAPFGLAWNGGLAGRLAVQGTYWALQVQDAFNERRAA